VKFQTVRVYPNGPSVLQHARLRVRTLIRRTSLVLSSASTGASALLATYRAHKVTTSMHLPAYASRTAQPPNPSFERRHRLRHLFYGNKNMNYCLLALTTLVFILLLLLACKCRQTGRLAGAPAPRTLPLSPQKSSKDDGLVEVKVLTHTLTDNVTALCGASQQSIQQREIAKTLRLFHSSVAFTSARDYFRLEILNQNFDESSTDSFLPRLATAKDAALTVSSDCSRRKDVLPTSAYCPKGLCRNIKDCVDCCPPAQPGNAACCPKGHGGDQHVFNDILVPLSCGQETDRFEGGCKTAKGCWDSEVVLAKCSPEVAQHIRARYEAAFPERATPTYNIFALTDVKKNIKAFPRTCHTTVVFVATLLEQAGVKPLLDWRTYLRTSIQQITLPCHTIENTRVVLQEEPRNACARAILAAYRTELTRMQDFTQQLLRNVSSLQPSDRAAFFIVIEDPELADAEARLEALLSKDGGAKGAIQSLIAFYNYLSAEMTYVLAYPDEMTLSRPVIFERKPAGPNVPSFPETAHDMLQALRSLTGAIF